MIISRFLQASQQISPYLNLIDLFISPDMSTTSTATALVARDCTLDDKTELLNHMCVLVLVRGDGTPFNAVSIQEEDIIELCVEVGQTHLKGCFSFQ